MLNKLSILLVATAAVALSASAASANSWHHHRHHNNSAISIGFDNIAFGYNDGYWDNGHQWHTWGQGQDYRSYRDHAGSHYYNYNHDRDHNMGWQR